MGYRSGSFVTGHFRNGQWVSPHYRGASISTFGLPAPDPDFTNKRTPLMRAAMAGDVGQASQLLVDGADPNVVDIFNQSALYYSTVNGHSEVSAVLITHGADTSQQIFAEKVLAGESLKHTLAARISQGWSCGQDNFSLDDIQAALAGGLNVSTVDERGRTPLIRAAIRGDSSAVKFFVQNGASVNVLDRLGQSALY